MNWADLGFYASVAILIAFGAAGVVAFSLAFYHFGAAVDRAKAPYKAALFGMLAFGMPSLFDDAGNRHRLLFFRYISIFLIFVLLLALGHALLAR